MGKMTEGKDVLQRKIDESIKCSQPIYHYMSFYKFYRMIATGSLYFVNPFIWKDKKEGYFFRLLRELNLEGNEEYKQFFERKISETFKTDTEDTKRLVKLVRTGNVEKIFDSKLDWFDSKCQSWTFKKNCIRFWNEYAKNEGVCISSNLSQIRQCDSGTEHPIEEILVKYEDMPDFNSKCENEIIDYLSDFVGRMYLTSKEMSLKRVFEYKETKFQWEDEVRLWLIAKGDEGHIDRKMKNFDFIQSVSVHPDASKDFCEYIKQICENNLPKNCYVGKADLKDSYCCCKHQ